MDDKLRGKFVPKSISDSITKTTNQNYKNDGHKTKIIKNSNVDQTHKRFDIGKNITDLSNSKTYKSNSNWHLTSISDEKVFLENEHVEPVKSLSTFDSGVPVKICYKTAPSRKMLPNGQVVTQPGKIIYSENAPVFIMPSKYINESVAIKTVNRRLSQGFMNELLHSSNLKKAIVISKPGTKNAPEIDVIALQNIKNYDAQPQTPVRSHTPKLKKFTKKLTPKLSIRRAMSDRKYTQSEMSQSGNHLNPLRIKKPSTSFCMNRSPLIRQNASNQDYYNKLDSNEVNQSNKDIERHQRLILLTKNKDNLYDQSCAAFLKSEFNYIRNIFIEKGENGFGFSVRGVIKSNENASGQYNFLPSKDHPALQYVDNIASNGKAESSGLHTGDFIIKVNGINVANWMHQDLKRLIIASQNFITLTVASCIKNPSIASEDSFLGITSEFYRTSIPEKTSKSETHEVSFNVEQYNEISMLPDIIEKNVNVNRANLDKIEKSLSTASEKLNKSDILENKIAIKAEKIDENEFKNQNQTKPIESNLKMSIIYNLLTLMIQKQKGSGNTDEINKKIDQNFLHLMDICNVSSLGFINSMIELNHNEKQLKKYLKLKNGNKINIKTGKDLNMVKDFREWKKKFSNSSKRQMKEKNDKRDKMLYKIFETLDENYDFIALYNQMPNQDESPIDFLLITEMNKFISLESEQSKNNTVSNSSIKTSNSSQSINYRYLAEIRHDNFKNTKYPLNFNSKILDASKSNIYDSTEKSDTLIRKYNETIHTLKDHFAQVDRSVS
ncbi:hypothetical protein A3Q56_01839 [Intoshia linei]|uniref:PDZ domain-containing protein n=1 Tax=Intoshia linei TaxID=1819745 RepID=A0A177B808_9BILA|nr:hypothetical protein A3Q56_01839 [Intoshia linei]